jgi:parvulin-like peptidyl-prolyl isomerase
VLAAVALAICLCTYFQRLNEKNVGDKDADLYDGEEGDGQPDDDDYAEDHPEAKKSAAANPMHQTHIAVKSEEEGEEEEEDDEEEEEEGKSTRGSSEVLREAS